MVSGLSADERPARQAWLGLVLAALVVGFAPRPVEAQAFNITQITNTTGGDGLSNLSPSINAAGTRIAFSSSRDLTPSPGNFDGNYEIFLFDTTAGLFTQITKTTGGLGNTEPSINAAGTRIAFASDRDLTPGSPGNADGNTEIFVFDTTTGLFTQVTNTTGGGVGGSGANGSASINAAGTRIAFASDRDLTPGSPGNADGNVEIFLFDTTTGFFTQITNTTGGLATQPGANRFPSINGAGTRIAFVSDRNLTPGSPGNADGNAEIFLFDTTTGLFTQITNTTVVVQANDHPSINAAGTRIAFNSRADLAPGNPGNADGGDEIFLFDTATFQITQITHSATGSSFRASISADGTRIVFSSNADLTPGSPGNADGNEEVFLFDTTTARLTQITHTTQGFVKLTAIDAAGDRIAFDAIDDITPGNPGNADGNLEIFLSTEVGGASIPTLSGWVQLVAAALLVLIGLLALRRGGAQASRTRS